MSMDIKTATDGLARLYPRIYFSCHRRHVRDPKTQAILSAHQASILDHLDSVEPVNVSTLAAHMGVTASTMSLSLDRLQTAGYVRRRSDSKDTRRVGILLTAAGVRIRGANSVLDPELVAEMMTRLTAAERERAIAGLGLLAGAADRTGRDVRRDGIESEPASAGERK